MKKLILLCAACGLAATAQNVTIDGTATGVFEGSCMTLFKIEGGMGVSVASDTVRNGSFHFDFPVDSGLTYLTLDGDAPGLPPMWRDLYLAPGANVKVDARDLFIRTWPVESSVAEQTENDRFLYANEDLWALTQQPYIEMTERRNKTVDPNNPDKAVLDEIMADYRKQSAVGDSARKEISKNEANMLRDYPPTPFKLIKMEELSHYNKLYGCGDILREVYATLSDEEKNSENGKHIYSYLYPQKVVEVGDMMADGDFLDLDGNHHSLAGFAGKWILLDFWSSGCYPCIMAIPELSSLHDKYAGEVEVVSLSRDPEGPWRGMSEAYQLSGNNWNDMQADRGIHQKYGVEAIPTFVLISPEGRIVRKDSGYGQGMLDRMLNRTINKVQPSYHAESGVRVVDNPDTESNSTYYCLGIERIELSDENTTVVCDVIYNPGWWFQIEEKACLVAGENKYPVTAAEGVTLGEKYYVGDDGKAKFKLIFPALPKDVRTVDLNMDDWKIKGIRLAE